jgi:hypothetical protein
MPYMTMPLQATGAVLSLFRLILPGNRSFETQPTFAQSSVCDRIAFA